MLQNNSRAFDLSTFSVLFTVWCSLFGFPFHASPSLSLAQAQAVSFPHSVWRTWSAALEICFFASGQREKRVGGVENVFWQVSLMRSYYEICKPPPFHPLLSPLLHPFLATLCNCNRAKCKRGGLTGRMSYIGGCVINAFIECRHTHTNRRGRGRKDLEKGCN